MQSELQLQVKILEAKLQKCKTILEQISVIKGADMIIKDKTNLKVEKDKKIFGITGDVYLVNHCMESLESHKLYMQQNGYVSQAETIEQAELERINIDRELRELALLNVKEDELNG